MDLPSLITDVPLSQIGSVYLLSAMAASSALFNAPNVSTSFTLIPDFAAVLASLLGDAATGSTGTEPESLIDAVLFLGFFIANSGCGIPKDHDTIYNNVLQRLSLLSANVPAPGLRYHAHQLTCVILHAHPSDRVRLAFIRDTIEHCPYENLKASAVGWLKDEILAAENAVQGKKVSEAETSIFSTAAALTSIGPILTPQPDTLMKGQSRSDSYATFQAYQAFYLAVLNLFYLLLSSHRLCSQLQIFRVVMELGVPHLLSSLSLAANDFREAIAQGELGYDDVEGKRAALASMDLVTMSVSEVKQAKEKAAI